MILREVIIFTFLFYKDNISVIWIIKKDIVDTIVCGLPFDCFSGSGIY